MFKKTPHINDISNALLISFKEIDVLLTYNVDQIKKYFREEEHDFGPYWIRQFIRHVCHHHEEAGTQVMEQLHQSVNQKAASYLARIFSSYGHNFIPICSVFNHPNTDSGNFPISRPLHVESAGKHYLFCPLITPELFINNTVTFPATTSPNGTARPAITRHY